MTVHPVVMATVLVHAAKAELIVAELEAKARTIPATRRSNNDTLRLVKQTKEAKAVADAWRTLARTGVGS